MPQESNPVEYFDALLNALQSEEGGIILAEIREIHNVLNSGLNNLATKPLPYPYKFDQEDLDRMRILRAQLAEIERIIAHLSVNCVAKKLELARNGEPRQAKY